MTDDRVEQLVDEHDDLDDIREALFDELPDLPEPYASMDYEEIRDLELAETTEEDCRQILRWNLERYEASAKLARAERMMNDE